MRIDFFPNTKRYLGPPLEEIALPLEARRILENSPLDIAKVMAETEIDKNSDYS